jgi:hypothetical protein
MTTAIALVIGAALAFAGVRAAAPPRRRRSARSVSVVRPRQLERSERAAEMLSTAGDVHVTLRPVLREVADERLRARGVELTAQPERARALLGDALWELVRPDRPPPADRLAPGLTPGERDALLDRLEAL